jgi:phenylpyruvate tautomerase
MAEEVGESGTFTEVGYYDAMPVVRIVTSADTPGDCGNLLRGLSQLLARELGKPESYVMTCLEPRAQMTFGGTSGPVCYVEVKNVGVFTPDVTQRLSAAICEKLAAAFAVPADRIYVEFSESPPHLWGHDGGTFA